MFKLFLNITFIYSFAKYVRIDTKLLFYLNTYILFKFVLINGGLII